MGLSKAIARLEDEGVCKNRRTKTERRRCRAVRMMQWGVRVADSKEMRLNTCNSYGVESDSE